MNLNCKHEHCYKDTSCALGHIDKTNCEHWSKIVQKDVILPEISIPIGNIPWNGYALPPSDLSILGGRGSPFVIGLIGPPDSGKTSLLTYVYMWILKTGRLEDWQFAGSWTLGGWESVVSKCRWTGEPPPTFPPHTSSAGRRPGFLHITFRDPRGRLRDVIFTDAPGEWFTLWSKTPEGSEAVGARWVIEHSDALLLLIDSAALADVQKLPNTRRVTRNLIERVGAVVNPQFQLTIVWTKDDVSIPPVSLENLQKSCDDFLPNTNVCRTTITKPETIVQCFVDILSVADKSIPRNNLVEPRLSNDPFLAFRGNLL
jgi:Double-GTPase 2